MSALRLLLPTALLAFTAVSVPAQRGGGHFSAPAGFHAGSPIHGFSSANLITAPRYAPAGRLGAATPRLADIGRRTRYGGPSRYRRSYPGLLGYGVPIPAGWVWPGYLSFDSGFTSDAGSVAPAEPYLPDAGPYAAPDEPAEAAPPSAYRPAYQPQQPAADPGEGTPVTLVFKDGRPPEEVRNYLITRTTLYVQEDHLRAIPVADLDLAETQRINRFVGIDFAVPEAVH